MEFANREPGKKSSWLGDGDVPRAVGQVTFFVGLFFGWEGFPARKDRWEKMDASDFPIKHWSEELWKSLFFRLADNLRTVWRSI